MSRRNWRTSCFLAGPPVGWRDHQSPARTARAGLSHTQTSRTVNDATILKIGDAQHSAPTGSNCLLTARQSLATDEDARRWGGQGHPRKFDRIS